MPGVHAVLTADDLPEPMRSERIPILMANPAIRIMRTQHALARDEVCYVGQAVAVVIADSRYIAEDAAALVAVDYDVLPAVERLPRGGEARRAARPFRPRRQRRRRRCSMAYGDVDAAFAKAAHVFEERIWLHRGGGMAMETRAVAASHDAGERSPHRLVVDADAASRPPHARRPARPQPRSIRMIAPDVGGGFGPKAPFYAEEAVIPAAAHEARPAGEMDRGPARAFPVRHAGARPVLDAGDRGRCATARFSACAARCCTTPAPSCRGASSCPTSRRRRCPAPT